MVMLVLWLGFMGQRVNDNNHMVREYVSVRVRVMGQRVNDNNHMVMLVLWLGLWVRESTTITIYGYVSVMVRVRVGSESQLQ